MNLLSSVFRIIKISSCLKIYSSKFTINEIVLSCLFNHPTVSYKIEDEHVQYDLLEKNPHTSTGSETPTYSIVPMCALEIYL